MTTHADIAESLCLIRENVVSAVDGPTHEVGMIKLIGAMDCEGIKLKRQQIVKVLGEIEYHPGREYPWFGKQGCVCQFFETRDEAIKFASGG